MQLEDTLMLHNWYITWQSLLWGCKQVDYLTSSVQGRAQVLLGVLSTAMPEHVLSVV